MSTQRLHLTRLANQPSLEQTLGEMVLFEGDKAIAKWKTLELPWLSNRRLISCIPEGTYTCKARESSKYHKHLHVTKVPDRDYILIHSGNLVKHTNGCILVGKAFSDINADGLLDVTASKMAMAELLAKAVAPIQLTITRG